jgi:hypothetical protein
MQNSPRTVENVDETLLNGVPIRCIFEYEPGEKEDAVSPGSPATATLVAAYVNGCNIEPVMSSHTIFTLEEALLRQME